MVFIWARWGIIAPLTFQQVVPRHDYDQRSLTRLAFVSTGVGSYYTFKTVFDFACSNVNPDVQDLTGDFSFLRAWPSEIIGLERTILSTRATN